VRLHRLHRLQLRATAHDHERARGKAKLTEPKPAPADDSLWRYRLAFFAVVALALIVRWRNLTSWDLWTDELHTLTVSSTGRYSFGPAYKLAPLHFILTRFTIGWFGMNELGGRILPFVAGALTVALVYLCGRTWVGRRAALIAALLIAISPWHVFWSQTARYFSTQVLVVLLALHCFLLYWKHGRRIGLVLTPLFIGAALAIHTSSAFYLCAFIAFVGLSWLFVVVSKRLAFGRAWLAGRHAYALLMLGVVLAVYVPISMTIGKYLTSEIEPWNPLWNLLGSLAFYMPPYLSLTALAGVAFLSRERDDLGWLLLALVVVPILLLAIASRITIASAPYCLSSLLAVVMLAGVALDRLLTLATQRFAWAAALLVAGMVGSQLFDLALYHTKYHGYKPRWREAAAYIRKNAEPGDIVVAHEADVMQYYLGEGDIRWYYEVEKKIGTPDFPPAATHGVWYIIYLGDPSLLSYSERAMDFVMSQNLRQVLLFNYGPKDRSLGVFYQASK
jgi:mannosyltransferase